MTQRQLMLNKQVSEEEPLLLDTNKCTIMEKITKKDESIRWSCPTEIFSMHVCVDNPGKSAREAFQAEDDERRNRRKGHASIGCLGNGLLLLLAHLWLTIMFLLKFVRNPRKDT